MLKRRRLPSLSCKLSTRSVMLSVSVSLYNQLLVGHPCTCDAPVIVSSLAMVLYIPSITVLAFNMSHVMNQINKGITMDSWR